MAAARFRTGPVLGIEDLMIALAVRTGVASLVKLTPDGYQELSHFTPLGGQSWTPPVTADGKLIIRNTKTLACFDLR